MNNTSIERLPVRVGMWINGVLNQPSDKSMLKHTAVLAMHSDADYLQFPAGEAFAKRGYTCLCANISRQRPLDGKLPEVKECVDYLKRLPSIEKVVLLGHSGGATLMSAYQAVAENGAGVFQGKEKILPCCDLPPLTPADGIMFIDSNWGNGVMTLLSLDPAVTQEENGLVLRAGYDLADEKNGYTQGNVRYGESFIRKYQLGQHERNERLIAKALERYKLIREGNGLYRDDEPFIAAGASQIAPNNRMFPQDIRLLSHTKQQWRLLHADGSETTEIIRSLRRSRDAKSFTGMLGMGAMISTVEQYLKSTAVHTLESFGYDDSGVFGIDWDSCFCCPPGNVRHITVPTLMMGMTGGYEFLAAEEIYEHSAAADKDMAFVEGASHMLTPARDCETVPGQFGDTIKTVFDYASRWLDAREG